MKHLRLLTTSMCIAALGLTAAHAQTTVEPLPPEDFRGGLVGTTHAHLAYSWVDLDNSGIDADAFSARLNQNSGDALDTLLEYEYIRTDRIAGSRITQHSLMLGARAFMPDRNFKPFVEGGIGWVWQRYFGNRDDSWAWMASAGVELAFNPTFALTPYVRYEDAPDLGGEGTWNYGARGNVWFTERTAVVAAVERDDDSNMLYQVGVAFRY